MSYKLPDLPCKKCGGNTSIHFIKSTGMDITPTGMFKTCSRCGYKEGISSLDDKTNATEIESVKTIKNRGVTLIELLVIIAIIGSLSTIILASLNKAAEKSKDTQQNKITKQQQSQNICTKQGGVPILDRRDSMIDCKFKQEELMPPCNGSDLPFDMPIQIKKEIQDQRKGYCI